MYACEAERLSEEYKQENARLVQDKLANDATLVEMRDELNKARRNLDESDLHFHQALDANDGWEQVDLQQRELLAQSAVREKVLTMLCDDKDSSLKEKDEKWKLLTASFINLSSQVAATRKELAEVRSALNESRWRCDMATDVNDDWVRVDLSQRELLAQAAVREKALTMLCAEKDSSLKEKDVRWEHLTASFIKLSSQVQLLESSAEAPAEESARVALDKDRLLEWSKSMNSKLKTLNATIERNRRATDDLLAATQKVLAEVRADLKESKSQRDKAMAVNYDWVQVDLRQRDLLAKAALRDVASMKALAEKDRALEESRETSALLLLQKDHLIDSYRNLLWPD
jgi:hypothetical protein